MEELYYDNQPSAERNSTMSHIHEQHQSLRKNSLLPAGSKTERHDIKSIISIWQYSQRHNTFDFFSLSTYINPIFEEEKRKDYLQVDVESIVFRYIMFDHRWEIFKKLAGQLFHYLFLLHFLIIVINGCIRNPLRSFRAAI